MDSGNHFYAPALATYGRGGTLAEVVMAGLIGMFPDIIGAYGNFIRNDNQKLYLWAHSDEMRKNAFLTGLLMSALSVFYPTFWNIAFGFLGYSLHLFLDSFTHVEGKRWWLWSERAFWNYSLWFALCIIALFVNPMHPWFAMIGGIWMCGVAAYCQVKYN